MKLTPWLVFAAFHWSTATLTALMRRAESGRPFSALKVSKCIASLTDCGMNASPPNMSRTAAKKSSRVALLALTWSASRRRQARKPMPSPTLFETTIWPSARDALAMVFAERVSAQLTNAS